MELLLIILSIAIIGLLTVLIVQQKKGSTDASQNKQPTEQLLLLQQQLQELNKTVDHKLGETHKALHENRHNLNKTIQDQFAQNTAIIKNITGQSAKLISEVTEKLTSLDKTNQQVMGFSQQLHDLEKVLKHQKQRGALGEAGLQLVLENILPPTAFSLQHSFPDGTIVDAAITTRDGIIPVDAKFSLDNYNRLVQEENQERKEALEKEFKNDLKKRIDETSKYIKPNDGTLEFAFMFIPAEAIYYDLLVNEVGAVKVNTRSLIDYAFVDKKVIIVSPTTFAAYLQTVLQGLRALQIEEGAKAIRSNVEKLGKHIAAYESYMKKLGSSMSTTVNHYNAAYKELNKIDKDIVKITEGERVIDPELIERPQTES